LQKNVDCAQKFNMAPVEVLLRETVISRIGAMRVTRGSGLMLCVAWFGDKMAPIIYLDVPCPYPTHVQIAPSAFPGNS
jgi:hypothetical protein